MDSLRIASQLPVLRHRHDDGSWVTLEHRPVHHDSAEHDPERRWALGEVYVCPRCDERVVVVSEGDTPDQRG
jgi:hypothetical protein